MTKWWQNFFPSTNPLKLVEVCKTRWVLRIDGLERFDEMYVPIVEAFNAIHTNVDKRWDSCAAEAFGLASICTNFDFLMTLMIVRMCLGYTKSATIQLQGAHIDVMKGLREVKTMLRSIQTACDLIDGYHSVWFENACRIAEQVDAPVKSPGICGRQRHRANVPACDVENYFKINSFS